MACGAGFSCDLENSTISLSIRVRFARTAASFPEERSIPLSWWETTLSVQTTPVGRDFKKSVVDMEDRRIHRGRFYFAMRDYFSVQPVVLLPIVTTDLKISDCSTLLTSAYQKLLRSGR
jgi:hypothetical protein